MIDLQPEIFGFPLAPDTPARRHDTLYHLYYQAQFLAPQNDGVYSAMDTLVFQTNLAWMDWVREIPKCTQVSTFCDRSGGA